MPGDALSFVDGFCSWTRSGGPAHPKHYALFTYEHTMTFWCDLEHGNISIEFNDDSGTLCFYPNIVSGIGDITSWYMRITCTDGGRIIVE